MGGRKQKLEKKERCKKCGTTKVVLVEYWFDNPYRYDGVSETQCLSKKCGARFGRWSGKELKEGEFEPPFGEKRYVTKESRHYNL